MFLLFLIIKYLFIGDFEERPFFNVVFVKQYKKMKVFDKKIAQHFDFRKHERVANPLHGCYPFCSVETPN